MPQQLVGASLLCARSCALLCLQLPAEHAGSPLLENPPRCFTNHTICHGSIVIDSKSYQLTNTEMMCSACPLHTLRQCTRGCMHLDSSAAAQTQRWLQLCRRSSSCRACLALGKVRPNLWSLLPLLTALSRAQSTCFAQEAEEAYRLLILTS